MAGSDPIPMKMSRWQTRKGEPFYKAFGLMMRGLVLTAGGEVESAVHQITSALAAYRSMGATLLAAMRRISASHQR